MKKYRVSHLARAKSNGEKITALTSYDALTAGIFDRAGIDVLLVGDSAANVVYGRETTLSLTVDETITMGRAVAAAAQRALVVVDMPFGSYEASVEQAVTNAVRIMKETGCAAVKLEGGRRETIAAIVRAGIPVIGHIGYTPQSEHALGGHVIQGRGEAREKLRQEALAVAEAGAAAVVIEMTPAEIASEITVELPIPTIGIGAGNGTDGQILVWSDFAGLTEKSPSFARRYAQLGLELTRAATAYRDDVRSGNFPTDAESFHD